MAAKGKHHKWTDIELEELQRLYADYATQHIADYLGIAWDKVHAKAKRLGLQKSEAYLIWEKDRTANKLRELGAKHRFPKGHEPMNKGTKMSAELKEKVKHTFFKKGRSPHNEKWDGYERFDKDGYVKVRIAKGRFALKHRKIWEAAHGKVPSDCAVVFKDGNCFNFDLSNLEMITRAELCSRNTVQRFPQELKDVIRLLARVNHKIKKANGTQQNG